MKNEATYLRRIELSLIWNIICARAWKFDICQSEEWLANGFQVCVPLANRTRVRRADVCRLGVHCVYCENRNKGQTQLLLIKCRNLKPKCCSSSTRTNIYKVTKRTEYFVSFNRELFQLQRIISSE